MSSLHLQDNSPGIFKEFLEKMEPERLAGRTFVFGGLYFGSGHRNRQFAKVNSPPTFLAIRFLPPFIGGHKRV
jgi:hypothetical protein